MQHLDAVAIHLFRHSYVSIRESTHQQLSPCTISPRIVDTGNNLSASCEDTCHPTVEIWRLTICLQHVYPVLPQQHPQSHNARYPVSLWPFVQRQHMDPTLFEFRLDMQFTVVVYSSNAADTYAILPLVYAFGYVVVQLLCTTTCQRIDQKHDIHTISPSGILPDLILSSMFASRGTSY